MKAYAKAILAALIAAGGVFVASMDGGMTAQEWAQVGLAGIVALGGVYAIPNVPNSPPDEP